MFRAPRFVAPQLATLVEHAPAGDDWAFEIKYDGYRLEALISNHAVRLFTRRGNDWTERFPGIAERLARFPVVSATLDGEVVALDLSGETAFGRLQQHLDASGRADGDIAFFVFDLLSLDGRDLRALPLATRRRELEALHRRARATRQGVVRLGQRMPGPGSALIQAACRLGLEGIIGKRIDAPYASGRNRNWVKVKCGQRQEFVVIGYTPPRRTRVGIGSLLLAVNEKGQLRYAGRVGSGFPDSLLRALLARLKRLARATTPLPASPAGIPRGVQWVKPVMVVEVAFTEWTADGALRHPVFQGIREDKPASEVVRERRT